MLSNLIGKGVQTFRIRNFNQHFEEVKDFGPNCLHYLDARKIVKLKTEGKYYALVRIPFKDVEEFIVQLENENFDDIDWEKIGDIAEHCRWKGPKLDKRYIN